ncbi:endolytic transglycosylase MltG [Sneathiella sp. HT1-7]|uniref:endolytic transglycosylase MltG n=1 Tax=Sneathiella sp. HT1-7 TaxID=2887192 RepID=UPI001D1360BC|nr:endolytic transglycosylase MltG [Sneathiella sp. HT1-7]MCC3304860.1 endolytic transglycosylase MltG [Sneathiella sp. HT1-7]
MRPVLYTLIALIVGAGLALGGALGYGWHLFKSPGPLETETVYVLKKGTGLRALATELEKNSIINNELSFILGVRIEENAARLQAGEYLVPAAISGIDLMALFVSGKVIERRLTIPEGLQSREIKALVEAAPGLEGEITREMPEGAFLPETYQYRLGDSRDELVGRMAAAMQGAIASVIATTPLPKEIKTPEDLVILASIVEKETAVPEERPRVAGVFLNRLRKGMMLQSDPTVVYGVTLGKRDLGRPLSKKDLATPTEYNTYQMMGLPKGPIANPGLESLSAVLQPEETKFLYFVADGTGGHAFSTTLDGHNDNVRKWRKLNKNK